MDKARRTELIRERISDHTTGLPADLQSAVLDCVNATAGDFAGGLREFVAGGKMARQRLQSGISFAVPTTADPSRPDSPEPSRNELKLEDYPIQKVPQDVLTAAPHSRVYAVDGAMSVQSGIVTTHAVTTACTIGPTGGIVSSSACVCAVPRSHASQDVVFGLMFMQEVMQACKTVEQDPAAVCLIDGSRMTAWIKVMQGLWAMRDDVPGPQLAAFLSEFASRDWMETYMLHDRIVGCPKLVGTDHLVRRVLPEFLGRADDKSLASLVLEPGECMGPTPIEHERIFRPTMVPAGYRGRKKFPELRDPPKRFVQVYYRPAQNRGAAKLEMNDAMMASSDYGPLLSWWRSFMQITELDEPFHLWFADQVNKEAVRLGCDALQHCMAVQTRHIPDAAAFLKSYRTDFKSAAAEKRQTRMKN